VKQNLITLCLASLFAVTIPLGLELEPWLYMWLLAFEMYCFFKWITLIYHPGVSSGLGYPTLYLVGWVGMDPTPFKYRNQEHVSGNLNLLFGGLANCAIGLLFFLSAEQLPSSLWLLQGWLICIGIIMILHFGSFRILAWFWRRCGFDVEPIMKFPMSAKTVSEFWGGRWNLAFNQLVYPFVFKPLSKRLGPVYGVLITFLISGLIHEIVISLPSRGGWGFPTLYFVLQGFTMLFEKSRVFKGMRPIPRRILSWLVIVTPAFFLFHPPFMKSVIIPFARSIGISI
jgi:hypothetical protein